MKPLLLLILAGLTCAGLLRADIKTEPIDFDKARQLIERQRSGEKLTADEQAYLDKAKEARKRSSGNAPAAQRKALDSLKPLCDMTAGDRYEGEDGGLYGGGHNTPPDALAKSAAAALAQVQVAWIKLANKGPSGTMPDHLTKLENDTIRVLQNARAKFPNLRIAYLGTRIWAGNAKGGLNPEPYAYETAFAVRHLIQRQMKGEDALAAGKSPLLLWGPYLWAEGTKGRQSDDLKWEAGDFTGDGVHPSESGREKVAQRLLEFFSTDPLARGWFAK